MTACPIRYQRQVPDRKGKIFYTSITSLSHISKDIGNEAAKSAKIYQYEPEYNVMKVAEDSAHYGDSKNNQ